VINVKKNEKKVFGFIWGVYILFLCIISIGCRMYGRPRKHIFDIMTILLLLLAMGTAVYYIVVLWLDKVRNKAGKVGNTIFIFVIMFILWAVTHVYAGYFLGKVVETVENISGKKCIVVTYEGFGGKETIYGYVNDYFRGAESYNRDEIIAMQDEKINTMKLDYRVSFASNNQHSIVIDFEKEEVVISLASGSEKIVKVKDIDRLENYMKEKYMKAQYMSSDGASGSVPKRMTWCITINTENEVYQAQSTYDYPKGWDELWSVIVETTDVKDKSEYGFAK
jgi:hypothetical protein